MSEHPVLFTGDMMLANLAGTKTETRRFAGLSRINKNPDDWTIGGVGRFYEVNSRVCNWNMYESGKGIGQNPLVLKCPYGLVGDTLWCRETWAWIDNSDFGIKSYYEYRSDMGARYPGAWPEYMDPCDVPCKWRASIHMPRKACRLLLRIDDIELQRIQDITEEQAIAEGVKRVGDGWCNYIMSGGKWQMFSARASFATLIESLPGGHGTWGRNLWCWRIKYSILDKK